MLICMLEQVVQICSHNYLTTPCPQFVIVDRAIIETPAELRITHQMCCVHGPAEKDV